MKTVLAVLAVLPLSVCAPPGDFGIATKAEWCRGLLEDAPTASLDDTEQTIEEVANIGDTIDLLCEDFK